MKFAVMIPTYNAEKEGFENTLKSIINQSVKPDDIYIVDSSSKDNTVSIAKKYNCTVEIISQSDFNHGLTRQKAFDKYKDYDYIIFLTQDVELASPNTFKEILQGFNDYDISVSYGRQLVRSNSSLSEKRSRLFNYPEKSILKSKESISELGLHTPFCSDSFACYKVADIINTGGFPKTDFAEDMLICARLIMSGKKVYYNAKAEVYHSHPYNIKAEYNRGKAIGKMHKDNKWLIDTFGKAEKKGVSLLRNTPIYLIPLLIFQLLPKYIGYKAGSR